MKSHGFNDLLQAVRGCGKEDFTAIAKVLMSASLAGAALT